VIPDDHSEKQHFKLHSPTVSKTKPGLAERSAASAAGKPEASSAQALNGHLSKFSGVCTFIVQYKENFAGIIGHSYREALYTK